MVTAENTGRHHVYENNGWNTAKGGRMFEAILAEMDSLFREGVFAEKTSFYFSVDDLPITVTVDATSFTLELGKTVENPDCSCKTDAQMFSQIWNDGYRPGIMDFLDGTIKCDAPLLLPQFLKAFGKE
jgi:hypothetical protein